MTSRVGVNVLRASPGVSRYNLRRIFSTSISSRSFFAYFPERYVRKRFIDQDRLTKWPALDVFCRNSKNEYQFSHYIGEYLRHFWDNGDLWINIESFEDSSDETKQVHKAVAVCSVTLSDLEGPNSIT